MHPKPFSPYSKPASGMTLLELSVMILVLLSFVAILFIGVHAWKRGADRAGCIMNIRQVQLAVRSYANTEDMDEGTDTRLLSPPVNLLDELVGADRFLLRLPVCPARVSILLAEARSRPGGRST